MYVTRAGFQGRQVGSLPRAQGLEGHMSFKNRGPRLQVA